MRAGIVQIDMHIRDERVLGWLIDRCEREGGQAQISHEEIATEFKCHRNTAAHIIRRLIGAGLIEVDRRKFRGGFTYKPAQLP